MFGESLDTGRVEENKKSLDLFKFVGGGNPTRRDRCEIQTTGCSKFQPKPSMVGDRAASAFGAGDSAWDCGLCAESEAPWIRFSYIYSRTFDHVRPRNSRGRKRTQQSSQRCHAGIYQGCAVGWRPRETSMEQLLDQNARVAFRSITSSCKSL